METHLIIGQSPLGKPVTYGGVYQPNLLFPVARAPFRESLGISNEHPFYGYDLWNAYEFSWLNSKGKPVNAIAQFVLPCGSPNIIESKSFKLYLNSFHQTQFNSMEEVSEILKKDLSECTQAPVLLEVAPLTSIRSCELGRANGICLDDLEVEINQYTVSPELLQTENQTVTETLYSDIFKSNCLGTGQPDWGSIIVTYSGPKIVREQLLKYLVSYRNHNEFNEHCAERVFMDILHRCKPQELTVSAHYTRRGGLDTNPCRSTNPQVPIDSTRFFRQ
jgi:7-cyano-7-deazaguanine reductase